MATPLSHDSRETDPPGLGGQSNYVPPVPLLDPQYSQPQQQLFQQQYQPHQAPPESSQQALQFDQFSDSVGNSNDDGDSFVLRSPDPFYVSIFRSIGNRYQLLLDASTPHWMARWTFSIIILFVFMLRIVIAQGWYIICYGLSIYYLNLFIGFLSPRIDPAFQYDGNGDLDESDIGPMLPTKANDEFRPFIRRLPEFKFWLSATKATLISFFLTLFEVFDMPVFWPILLIYFIMLFISTMRQQIKHMIKYGYVPWDKGKKKYGVQKEDPASLYPATI